MWLCCSHKKNYFYFPVYLERFTLQKVEHIGLSEETRLASSSTKINFIHSYLWHLTDITVWYISFFFPVKYLHVYCTFQILHCSFSSFFFSLNLEISYLNSIRTVQNICHFLVLFVFCGHLLFIHFLFFLMHFMHMGYFNNVHIIYIV